MNPKALISLVVLALVAGCGKKDKDESNSAPVVVSEPEALVTVAQCHQPDDTQQHLLLTIAKTKDDAPISPNTTNSMLVLFFKNNPSNENQFAYPVNLKEGDASISIEGAAWTKDLAISATIDRSSGKGKYTDSLQSFELDCKMSAAK